MSDKTLIKDIGHFLLGLLLVASSIWALVSPSFESVISILTSLAGVVASYEALSKYKFWGRITLLIATITSLFWVVGSPNGESIVSLLSCAIGSIASFSDDSATWTFPSLKANLASDKDTISLGAIKIFSWTSWIAVSYICLYWAFESYIPGLLIDITKMAAPLPQTWLIQNAQGFIILFGLTGTFVVSPILLGDEDSPFAAIFSAGFFAVIASVINAWISYLVYIAHGWNSEILTAIMVMILAHMLLIGFIASIGMALFGIGVAIIWLGIMLMLVWITTLIKRYANY